jgi:hypothetical protein
VPTNCLDYCTNRYDHHMAARPYVTSHGGLRNPADRAEEALSFAAISD